MAQLNDIILEFRGFAEETDGVVSPFLLRISSPEFEAGRGFFCRVYCPYFREMPFLIFGVDQAQACELSIEFIRQMLTDEARLVDQNGNNRMVIRLSK